MRDIKTSEFYKEFVEAAKETAVDLNLRPEDIVFEHGETKYLGLDYTADIEKDGLGFSFHIRTITNKIDPHTGLMKASLTINYDKDLDPYWFHEQFSEDDRRPVSLNRWVAFAVSNYRQTHEKVDLSSLFGEMDLIVLGFPGYGTDEEASLVFNGLLKLHNGKAKIYQFRHIRQPDLYRSISYGLLVATKNSSRRFWIVFPDTCGLDSGEAYHSYLLFETLISQLRDKMEVEIRRFDIPYDELETFLFKRAVCFHSSKTGIENINPGLVFTCCPKILANSESQFSTMTKCFDNGDFGTALRSLRALVQQAEENILVLKVPSYEKPNDANILKLAGVLIANNLLNGELMPWIQAFVSIANRSSHGDFPTEKEMQEERIRKKVMLTFETGLQILEELNAIVHPPIRMVPIKPTIKIAKARIEKRPKKSQKKEDNNQNNPNNN